MKKTKSTNRKINILLDKFDQELLDNIINRTGKSPEDILKLALYVLNGKLDNQNKPAITNPAPQYPLVGPVLPLPSIMPYPVTYQPSPAIPLEPTTTPHFPPDRIYVVSRTDS